MAEGANTKEAEKHLELTPGELFNKLYKEQNGIETDSKQKEYINKIIEEIWEGER